MAQSATVTKHTCVSQGGFGRRDPSCPRCQELTLEKMAEQNPDTVITLTRAPRPDYPQAEVPAKVSEAMYPTNVKKNVEQHDDGTVDVSYTYQGKTYGGCLSFQQVRTNGQGMHIGTEVVYVLYPTAEQRDAAYAERERQRQERERMRMELRRIQAQEQSDLIGPNGMPIQTGMPNIGYGGMAPMGMFPPTAGILQG